MDQRRMPTLHDSDQCQAGLAHAARLLHEEFDSALGQAEVDAHIAAIEDRFVDATVLTFIPLLVRRYAREELLRRLDAIDASVHASESALLAGATSDQ
jgi:hypothetical protein